MSKFSLLKIDMFGSNVALNLAGKPKAQSTHGAVFSLIFIVFIAWAIYHTSKDLFNRDDPKTTTYQLFSETPRKMIISKETFSFAIGVQTGVDGSFIHFVNESIYRVEAYWIQKQTISVDGKYQDKLDYLPLELETCTSEHFGELSPNFAVLPLSLLYCLKLEQPYMSELRIQGATDSPLYENIAISIARCNNYTSGGTCAPNSVIDEALAGAYFTFYYSNLAINPKNYTRPDVRYRDSYSQMLCTDCYKTTTFSLSHTKVISDYGWLVEESAAQDYIKFSHFREMMDLRPNANGYLIDFFVQSTKLETFYTRSYVKVQDILGEVNGFAAAAMLVIVAITTPYSQMKVHESFINEVFNLKISKKPSKQKKKKEIRKIELSQEDKLKDSTATANEKVFEKDQRAKDLGTENPDIMHSPKSEKGFLVKKKTLYQEKTIKFRKEEDSVKAQNVRSLMENSEDKRILGQSKTLRYQRGNTLMETEKSKTQIASFVEEKTLVQIRNKKDIVIEDGAAGVVQRGRNKGLSPKLEAKEPEEEYDVESSFVSIENQSKFQSFAEAEKIPIRSIEKKDQLGLDLEEQREQEKREMNTENKDYEGPLKDKINKKDYSDKLDINFWEYIISYVWKPKHVKEKFAVLEQGKQNIQERLDLFNIMKKFREIDKLKALLLEDDQLVLFDALPKPELTTEAYKQVNRQTIFAHSLLRKPKFVEESMRHDQVIRSYQLLKGKSPRTRLDQKLIAIYDELIGTVTAAAGSKNLAASVVMSMHDNQIL